MAYSSAFPYMYGAKLLVADPSSFAEDYVEIDPTSDHFVLKCPTKETLAYWAKTCLCVKEFFGDYRLGGWSPFRSGEVQFCSDAKLSAYFKFGDDDRFDFHVQLRTTAIPLEPWLQSVQSFSNLAVFMAIADVSFPCLRVQQMLHAEWGGCARELAQALMQEGFRPAHLDNMVEASWLKAAKLPIPKIFEHWYDTDVQRLIVQLCRRAASNTSQNGGVKCI